MSEAILEYRIRYWSIVPSVNLTEPADVLAGGLTLPLLRALAARSTPASVAQLRRVAGVGTEAGTRRALDRLSISGLVSRDLVGERAVYMLNYDHLLRQAVEDLLRVNDELMRRLRKELDSWTLTPVSAALYGSAARRDGAEDSDIDLLLVRPPLRTKAARNEWQSQVDGLRDRVFRWTGNHCQITDRPVAEIRRFVVAGEPIVESWRQDAVTLCGLPVDKFLAAK
jgi:predicted nucleotidyltransferase